MRKLLLERRELSDHAAAYVDGLVGAETGLSAQCALSDGDWTYSAYLPANFPPSRQTAFREGGLWGYPEPPGEFERARGLLRRILTELTVSPSAWVVFEALWTPPSDVRQDDLDLGFFVVGDCVYNSFQLSRLGEEPDFEPHDLLWMFEGWWGVLSELREDPRSACLTDLASMVHTRIVTAYDDESFVVAERHR
jgi:hypothetical protein